MVENIRCRKYKMSEKNEEKILLERKERVYIGTSGGSACSNRNGNHGLPL
jgi:hypothetical protein